MRIVRGLLVLAAMGIAVLSPAVAQSSASYRLTEQALNAGGHPANGVIATSPGYRITLDAIGDGVVAPLLSGTGYALSNGFVSTYPPPGEVSELRLVDATTLDWLPETSAEVYELYRNGLGTLPGTYGACLQPGVGGTTTTDPAAPPSKQGYFYLVTARNLLGEEGTKGTNSAGAPRPNPAPCP